MNLAKKRHTPHRSGLPKPAKMQINYGSSSSLHMTGQKRSAHQAMEEDLIRQDMEEMLFEDHRDGQCGFQRMLNGTNPPISAVRPPPLRPLPGLQTASPLPPGELRNSLVHQIASKGKTTGSRSVRVPREVGPKRRKPIPIPIPIPQDESNGHPKNLSLNDMSNGELNDDNNVENDDGYYYTGSRSVHVTREVGPKRRKPIPIPQAESNGHPKNLSVNAMSNGELNDDNNLEDDNGYYNVDVNQDGQYNVEENPDNEENMEENLDNEGSDEHNQDDEENAEGNEVDEENAEENEDDEENAERNEPDEETDEDIEEFDFPEDGEETAKADDMATGHRSIGQGNVVDGVVSRKPLEFNHNKITDWRAIRDLGSHQRNFWPGPYISWRSVPKACKENIWTEFMKVWEASPDSEAICKRAFHKTAASLYEGTLARERRAALKRRKTKFLSKCVGQGPVWMKNHIWNALVRKWLSKEWQAKSKKNRANRMTEKDGCMPKHTGGCLTFEEHASRMAVELGRVPTFEEVFHRVHKSRKGSTLVFVDTRAELAMTQVLACKSTPKLHRVTLMVQLEATTILQPLHPLRTMKMKRTCCSSAIQQEIYAAKMAPISTFCQLLMLQTQVLACKSTPKLHRVTLMLLRYQM